MMVIIVVSIVGFVVVFYGECFMVMIVFIV